MALRVVVGEAGVVDVVDARGVGRDREQGRQHVGAVDHVRHHDQHLGDVARGDEPLLAADPVAGVGAFGGRGDPRRVGAGLTLGHGVRVLQIRRRSRGAGSAHAARPTRGPRRCRRWGCASRCRWWSDRTAPRREPTPSASSPGRRTRESGGRRSAAPRSRAALIRSIALLGQAPVQALGLLLERDQLGVDEIARALLQFRLIRCQLALKVGQTLFMWRLGGDRHLPLPPLPRAAGGEPEREGIVVVEYIVCHPGGLLERAGPRWPARRPGRGHPRASARTRACGHG